MIPAESPDVNPIENIFQLLQKKVRKEAFEVHITQESYAQFCNCITKKIKSFPVDVINRSIDSIKGRLQKVTLLKTTAKY